MPRRPPWRRDNTPHRFKITARLIGGSAVFGIGWGCRAFARAKSVTADGWHPSIGCVLRRYRGRLFHAESP
jgi:hypothetical protein